MQRSKHGRGARACLDPPFHSLLPFPWLPQQGQAGLLLPSARRQGPLRTGDAQPWELLELHTFSSTEPLPQALPCPVLSPGHRVQLLHIFAQHSNGLLLPPQGAHFTLTRPQLDTSMKSGPGTALTAHCIFHLSCTKPGAAGLQPDAPRISSILHHQLLMLAISW